MDPVATLTAAPRGRGNVVLRRLRRPRLPTGILRRNFDSPTSKVGAVLIVVINVESAGISLECL